MSDGEEAQAASLRAEEARKPPWPRPSAALLIALIVALLVAGTGWCATLRHGRWLSTPHRVSWIGPDGQPLSKERGECHGDIGFTALVDGDLVWVMCQSHETFPNGALGVIDTTRMEAKILGVFPERAAWTTGLLPGPHDSLAIVVALENPGGLAVAIADRNGWLRAPTRLPGEGDIARVAGLLGMSFRGDVLEVVVCPVSADDQYCSTTPPIVVTFAPGAAPTERTIARSAIRCEGFCQLAAAYRRPGDSTWRFLLDDYKKDGHGPIDVAEDGTFVALPPGLRPSRGGVDLTHFGVIARPYQAPLVLWPDGRLEAGPSYEGWSTYFEVDASRARAVPTAHRFLDVPSPSMEHVVGTRRFRTAHVKSDEGDGSNAGTPAYHDERLSIVDATNPASPKETFPARLHDCTELAYDGLFLPRNAGGFMLLASSGCFVMLDAALQRTDKDGVVAHLRRRGSMYLDWNEPWHAWELGFVLFGLLVALLIAFALPRLRRRPLTPYLVGAGFGYAAAAGIMLIRLWPLMR